MKNTTPALLLLAALAACDSGPQSTATIELRELDGATQTARAVGTVAWSGGGEQIAARFPARGNEPSESFGIPLRITRLGPYTASDPVSARALGRTWVSRIDAPPRILVDRLWFTGDREHPWRHFGTVEVDDPRPVDHSLDLLSFKVEFSIQGPDCGAANPGESRCGVPWELGGGAVDLTLTRVDNDCPEYVVETWIDSPTAQASTFQIDAGGYKRINCIDLGDGRRLCGSHEDEMEVGDCLWNGAISLTSPDELRIEGVAACGESGALRTCSARYRLQ